MLFLTDGLPTVGQTFESAIRQVAVEANPHHRRIFTFGVGLDVNTPLLDRLAVDTRAIATFVLPKEDVEVKVAQVFKRLIGPVLTDPKLEVIGAADDPPQVRISELLPAKLPDLFEDDQLVLLGRYTGDDPLTFRLSGDYLGKARTFEFTFGLDQATVKNAFVPRLWASRKIAVLTDAVRDLGADSAPGFGPMAAASNPKLKELTDEIVRLSTQFGVLSEYTAFLALEGTDLSRNDAVLAQASQNFVDRALQVRVGQGAVNQAINTKRQRSQMQLNMTNGYVDQNMNRVSIANVQQVSDRAFFQRNGRWVDSRIVNDENRTQPRRIIEFGSPEFHQLVDRLAAEGRQGTVALGGDILMVVDGEPVLVRCPAQ